MGMHLVTSYNPLREDNATMVEREAQLAILPPHRPGRNASMRRV